MPIYEYRCTECGHRFEALVFQGRQPDCPACRGSELEKLLSSFAVGGSRDGACPAPPAPGGG